MPMNRSLVSSRAAKDVGAFLESLRKKELPEAMVAAATKVKPRYQAAITIDTRTSIMNRLLDEAVLRKDIPRVTPEVISKLQKLLHD